MADSSAIWNLHLIYRLSQLPARFDADVRGKVRALEGVPSVDGAPSHDASTRLAFSTRYANVIDAAVAAKLSATKRLPCIVKFDNMVL
jgi:hypothetical protein